MVAIIAQLKKQVSLLQVKLSAANEYVVRVTGAPLPEELISQSNEVQELQSDSERICRSFRLECEANLTSFPQDVEQVASALTSDEVTKSISAPVHSSVTSRARFKTRAATTGKLNVATQFQETREEFLLTPRMWCTSKQPSNINCMYADAFELANIAAIPVPD